MHESEAFICKASMDIENESNTMKVLEYKEMKLYFILIVLLTSLKVDFILHIIDE